MTVAEKNALLEQIALMALSMKLDSRPSDHEMLRVEAEIFNSACRVIAGAIRSLKDAL